MTDRQDISPTSENNQRNPRMAEHRRRAVLQSTGATASPNTARALQDQLQQVYTQRDLNDFQETSAAAACLRPLLTALDWTGERRHLEEALPHFDEVSDIDALRALLARLNFRTERKEMPLRGIGANMLPCLFEDADGALFVLLSVEADGRILCFDGARRSFEMLSPSATKGQAYLIGAIDRQKTAETHKQFGWVQNLIGNLRGLFATLFLLTFCINMLGLAVPVYVMSVYDKAIGAKSLSTLLYLFSAIAIIIAAEIGLRAVRTRTIAFLGARFESLLAIGAFEKLLNMPVGMTESASISAQITRLRQFEGVRELFTGALGNAIFDLPFAAVFLVAIFVIGGPVGFIPMALLIIFVAMTAVTIPLTRTRVRKAGEAKTRQRNFLMEATQKHEVVRLHSAEDVWTGRFQSIASDYLLRQFKAHQLNTILQTISQALVMIAGVAIIALGALQVLWGNLSIGALVAIVALVWRLLSPLQAVFLGLNRVSRTLETFKQINAMMRIETERQPGHIPTFFRSFKGDIDFVGVGFRYGPIAEPAMRGVSLTIPKNQVVAITGESGAGKSTLLKLVANLYQPQVGVVRIDGLDIRQIDPAELRHGVAYAPQRAEFFYGTIAQNFKLANPGVEREAIEQALRDAGANCTVAKLSDGIDTRLSSLDRQRLPGAFLQQLVLARAYAKDSSIYLLDDPGSRLDVAGDAALIKKLGALRGKATVLLVTHRPSHMYAADRVIVLNQGLIAADGTPDEIVPQLLEQPQKASVS